MEVIVSACVSAAHWHVSNTLSMCVMSVSLLMCQVWVRSLTFDEKVDVEQRISEMSHIQRRLASLPWDSNGYPKRRKKLE